jgi:hypothetical protein
VETLAEDLGTTTTSLPALVASLTGSKGTVLSLLSKLGGLSLTLLNPESKENGSEKEGTTGKEGANGKEGAGGKEGASGKGSSESSSSGGGAGGAGQGSAGGSGGATTLVVNLAPANTAPAAKAKVVALAKVKIVSRKVSRGVATIVAQVPAAGKVTLSGKGVISQTRKAGKAERVTLSVKLSKAGSASLRKHRRRLKVALTASFKATAGQASSAKTTVLFT